MTNKGFDRFIISRTASIKQGIRVETLGNNEKMIVKKTRNMNKERLEQGQL